MMVTKRNDSGIASGGAAPAPDWLRNLVGARNHYEENLGWPATIDVEPHRVVIATGSVLDAVVMPVGVAEAVLLELRIALQAGPVISTPGVDQWTFLTAPAPVRPAALPATRSAKAEPAHPAQSAKADPAQPARSAKTEPARPVIPAELRAMRVHGLAPGTPVTLPSETGSPYWIEPPRRRHCLPPWPVVVATTRRVVARQDDDDLLASERPLDRAA